MSYKPTSKVQRICPVDETILNDEQFKALLEELKKPAKSIPELSRQLAKTPIWDKYKVNGMDLELINGRLWLAEDYTYTLPWDKSKSIFIKKGTRTNFASIPKVFQWLISPMDKELLLAAAIHDALVGEFSKPSDSVSWGEACDIMIKVATLEGAKLWKRTLVYYAVMAHGKIKGKK